MFRKKKRVKISDKKIEKMAMNIIAMAEIRHDYYGIKIYVNPSDHNPAHIHATFQGYNSAFDINTGKEIRGNLPNRQKKQMAVWFQEEKEKDMKNWSYDTSGNWHKSSGKKASYDLNKPLSHENDFWNDMIILKAIPYHNYDIELWFADGSHKIYNMKKMIEDIPEIEALKDLNIFMNIIEVGYGLHWNHDIDLDSYEFFKYGKDVE